MASSYGDSYALKKVCRLEPELNAVVFASNKILYRKFTVCFCVIFVRYIAINMTKER